MRALRSIAAALCVSACLVACGNGPSPSEIISAQDAPVARSGMTTTSITSASASTSVPPTTAAAVGPATTGAPATTSGPAPAVLTPPTTANAVPALLSQLAGSVGQVIVVTAPSLGTSNATLTAFQRGGGSSWSAVFGPWPARVGSSGFAPPGEKREGDGRTPSGTYGFDFFFGVDGDPGVKFEYRRITPSIVWVDDPASPLYNQWVDRSQRTVDAHAEDMYQPTAYRYGAAIAYNSARAPNLGSAIFLHASTGRATAGCVSVHVDQLVQLLTWLDPARDPRIVMGVG